MRWSMIFRTYYNTKQVIVDTHLIKKLCTQWKKLICFIIIVLVIYIFQCYIYHNLWKASYITCIQLARYKRSFHLTMLCLNSLYATLTITFKCKTCSIFDSFKVLSTTTNWIHCEFSNYNTDILNNWRHLHNTYWKNYISRGNIAMIDMNLFFKFLRINMGFINIQIMWLGTYTVCSFIIQNIDKENLKKRWKFNKYIIVVSIGQTSICKFIIINPLYSKMFYIKYVSIVNTCSNSCFYRTAEKWYVAT